MENTTHMQRAVSHITTSQQLLLTQFSLQTRYFPIFQKLSDYNPTDGLEKFLPHQWTQIQTDSLIIIWDGLDEVALKDFALIKDQIATFADKYPTAKIVVSCRTNFYNLPTNSNSQGTLSNFKIYQLQSLRMSEVASYVESRFGTNTNGQEFSNAIAKAGITEIATTPFSLSLLADIFNKQHKLPTDRNALFELYLSSRIQDDLTSTDGQVIKKVLTLLSKVAISLILLGVNSIRKEDLQKLLSEEELQTLSRSSLLDSNSEQIWTFEHNNVLEYLAATKLAELSFNKIINLITFEPNHSKLSPNWINTLTLLFGILEKDSERFQSLLDWMAKNEREIIVKFEKTKLPKSFRFEIFKNIFNYYKTNGIWIYSNKFNEKDLASFAPVELAVPFLISEIRPISSSKINKQNAINILGFMHTDVMAHPDIKTTLTKQIKENQQDGSFVFSAIYALINLSAVDVPTGRSLMSLLQNQKDQFIRAAMYRVIKHTHSSDEFVGYLIEGLELYGERTEEHGIINLADEILELHEVLKEIKSPGSLNQLIQYICSHESFLQNHNGFDLIEKIVVNASEAYLSATSLFSSMLNLLVQASGQVFDDRIMIIARFFELTDTNLKAFKILWAKEDGIDPGEQYAITKLVNNSTIDFLIDQYNHGRVDSTRLNRLYYSMISFGSDFKNFSQRIAASTSYKVPEPTIDYTAIHLHKDQKDFDLLFKPKQYLKECLKIFKYLKKNAITFSDLNELRTRDGQFVLESEFYFSVLRLLRDFTRNGEEIDIAQVKEWFIKKDFVDYYTIAFIYEKLKGQKKLTTNTAQVSKIKHWTKLNAQKIDFTKAIYTNDAGQVNIITKAIYVSYFMKRFDIRIPKKTLLDMLAFAYVDGHSVQGIDYLLGKLSEKEVAKRVSINLKIGNLNEWALRNNAKYACEHGMIKCYPDILKEIANATNPVYLRKEMIDAYVKGTKDINSLKEILETSSEEIRWHLVNLFIQQGENSFLAEYLIRLLTSTADLETRFEIAQYLVRIKNLIGLEEYVRLIMSGQQYSRFNLNVIQFTDVKAVPHLMKLLDYSYQHPSVDPMFNLASLTLDALSAIATFSEDNLEVVTHELNKFKNSHVSKYPNVNFIEVVVERYKGQFFINKSKSLSIDDVKNKLELLD